MRENSQCPRANVCVCVTELEVDTPTRIYCLLGGVSPALLFGALSSEPGACARTHTAVVEKLEADMCVYVCVCVARHSASG